MADLDGLASHTPGGIVKGRGLAMGSTQDPSAMATALKSFFISLTPACLEQKTVIRL